MNRRTYIKTVAASPLLTTIGTVSADSHDDDDERTSNMPPTYYTVSMPSISMQLIHISIPNSLLDTSRTVTVYTDTSRRVLSIAADTPDSGKCTMRNYTVDDTDPIASVEVGGVEGRKWDVLEVQRAAMFFPAKDSDEGYVGVLSDNSPVTLETPEREYVYEVGTYTQRRVPTGDPSEVDVWTIRDGERASIPLYPVSMVSSARWEKIIGQM